MWTVASFCILEVNDHYLGRVAAVDEKAATDRAMEEFGIDPARRFRLIAEALE